MDMDTREAPDATPWQPQMRFFGLILTALGFLFLVIGSIWLPIFPTIGTAANITLGIGIGAALFCFITGALTFYWNPYTQSQMQRILLAASLGLAVAICIEWFFLFLPGLLPAVPFLMYSAMGPMSAFITIGVAPFEEYLCIFVQQLGMRSTTRAGPILGITGQAIIFAVLHFRAYLLSTAILVMFFVGLTKGIAFYYVPYAEVPIIIHMGLNALAVIPL